MARAQAGANFTANLYKLRQQARYAPWAATPVVDSNSRVSQLFDQASGYSLALYFTLDQYNFVSRLEWVEVGPLEPAFHAWD